MLTVVLCQTAWSQGWPTSAGSAGRERRAVLPLESSELVPVWSISTFGPTPVRLFDLDGDPELEILLEAGGRLKSLSQDGSLEWVSIPAELALPVVPPVDLTGDGRPEILSIQDNAGLAVVAGLNGDIVWESDSQLLSRVGKVLVHDFDGDGIQDFLAAESDCGPTSNNVGRAVAYSLVDGAARELFRLEEGNRDYHCSVGMVVADLEGDGEPEIVALGNRYAYAYSTVTGSLVGTSEDLGSIPFGYAGVYALDADKDGDHEILMATDNAFAPDINSRRVLLVDAVDGRLVVSWQDSVANVQNDRHTWSATSIVDLDGEGSLDFVHAFYDHSSERWTTYVRRLRDGAVVGQIGGELLGVTPGGRVVVGNGQAARVLGWRDGGFVEEAVLPGDQAAWCNLQDFDVGGRPGVVMLTDASDLPWLWDTLDDAGEPVERSLLRGADGATLLELEPGEEHDLSCQRVLAAARLDGKLETRASKVPWTDTGFRLPMQSSAAFLVSSSGPVTLGRGSELFTVNNPSLDTPVEGQRGKGSISASTDVDGDGQADWLVLDTQGTDLIPDIAAVTSSWSTLWSREGWVDASTDQRVGWYYDGVSVDLNGDGRLELLAQSGDPSNDVLRLMPISGATGEPLWEAPFESTYATWGAGFPVGLVGEAGRVVSLARGVLRIHEATSNQVVFQLPPAESSIVRMVSTQDRQGRAMLVTGARFDGRWRAFDEHGTLVWEQRSISDDNNARWWGTEPAIAHGVSRSFLVEGRLAALPFDHNLVVLDLETGQLLHRVLLEDGAIASAEPGRIAEVSLNPGVALDGSAEQPATYLVSGSDGHLYLLDLTVDPDSPGYPDNMLVRSWSFPTSIGNISVADVDGDGFSEVIVPGFEGTATVLDHPEQALELEVADTDCISDADVDTVSRRDVFCGAWTLTEGLAAESYLAVVVDDETGARISEPVSTSSSRVRIEGLNLAVGRRYRIEVQGFSGSGSSPAFTSDGAVVVDAAEPPALSLRVEPRLLVVGEDVAAIDAEMFDASGLASFELRVEGASGVEVLATSLLNTTEHTVQTTWTSLEVGTYQVVLLAEDFTGLIARAEETVEVVLELPGEDIVEPSTDIGGSTETLDPHLVTEEGIPACGCDVRRSPGNHDLPVAVVFGLLGLMVIRRV